MKSTIVCSNPTSSEKPSSFARVNDISRRRFPHFPSWVGEFDVIADVNKQELVYTMITHHTTGHSETPQVEVTAMDNRVLSLRGIQIDEIAELAEPWTWHGPTPRGFATLAL